MLLENLQQQAARATTSSQQISNGLKNGKVKAQVKQPEMNGNGHTALTNGQAALTNGHSTLTNGHAGLPNGHASHEIGANTKDVSVQVLHWSTYLYRRLDVLLA